MNNRPPRSRAAAASSLLPPALLPSLLPLLALLLPALLLVPRAAAAGDTAATPGEPATAAAPADTLSLDAVLAIAMRGNLGLQASRQALEVSESARARAHIRKQLPELRADLSASGAAAPFTVYDTTGTRHLLDEESLTTDLSLTLAQPLPGDASLELSSSASHRQRTQGESDLPTEVDGVAQATLSLPLLDRSTSVADADQRAAWDLESARIRYAAARADLRLRIIQAYYGLVRAQGTLAIREQFQAQSRAQAERARAQFRAGLLAEGDLLQLEVARDLGEAALLAASGSVDRAREALNLDLGRPPDAPLLLSRRVPPPPTLAIPPDSLIAIALENREEIRQARLELAAARLTTSATRANQGINGSLRASLGLRGNGHDWRSTFDHTQYDRSIGLNLNWSLWDFGYGHRLVDESRASLERSRISLEDTRRRVLLDLRELLRSHAEAVARAAVLARAAEAAERAYSIARKRFEAGNIDSQRLLQEQASQRQARTDHLNAVIDVHLAVAALERATRRRLTRSDRAPTPEDPPRG